MPKFKVGDKILIKTPHMGNKKGDEGVIAEVSNETPYAIKFPDKPEIHKWYVGSEIEEKLSEAQLRQRTVAGLPHE